jgi:butyrate response factor 1
MQGNTNCLPLQERGHCHYGTKCQFAHGPDELRSVARHWRYKTILCSTYHSTGFCPYGSRCNFIHDELVAPNANDQVSISSTFYECLFVPKYFSSFSLLFGFVIFWQKNVGGKASHKISMKSTTGHKYPACGSIVQSDIGGFVFSDLKFFSRIIQPSTFVNCPW